MPVIKTVAGYYTHEGSYSLEDIKELHKLNMTIHLIKAYRFLTGQGLRESKEAIENNSTYDKTVALFSPLLPQLNVSPNTMFLRNDKIIKDKTAKKTLSDDDLLKKKVTKGMITACNVWKDMGFANPVDACQTVLNNIKEHGWAD